MFENFHDLARQIQKKLVIAPSIEASEVCNKARNLLAQLNPALTKSITIVSFKNGFLKGSSTSSTAKNEFIYIKKEFLFNLNQALPKGPTVKDILFK